MPIPPAYRLSSQISKLSSLSMMSLALFSSLNASGAENMLVLEALAARNLEDPAHCSSRRLYDESKYASTLSEFYAVSNTLAPPAYLPRTILNNASCDLPLPPMSRDFSPIQDLLNSLAFKNPVKATPLDLACVAVAQKHFGSSGWGFIGCSKGKAYPFQNRGSKTTSRVPCRTNANISLVAHTFKSVSQCLGVNSREAFKVFSKESGMMLNSRSFTGARGIGQLTQIAMQHVQDVDQGRPWGATKASLELSKRHSANIVGNGSQLPKPECDPLHQFERSFLSKDELANPCSILQLPEGAFRSMLYSMKLYSYYKAEIEAIAQSVGAEKFLGKDYREIIQAATAYSYSAAGPGHTRPTFKALLLAAKKNYKGKTAFLNQLKANLVRRAPRVAGEIRTYVSGEGKGLKDRYAAIKAELGGRECF
jgi:hypothetical protein